MAYLMHIIDQESGEGFDITELAYNITHTTTLQGQAGKLTFNLRKDPNDILQMSMGSVIKFWCDDVPVFYGYVFNLKVNNEEIYKVTAYDQMRYLQNHDYFLAENLSLQEIFKKICTQLKLKNKILGHAKYNHDAKIEKHLFADVSYFDILQYAINETNVFNTKKDFEQKSKKLNIGTTVDFIGGNNYVSPTSAIPASSNRTAGKATITNISKGSLHPYHLIGSTSNVYGWCDEDSISVNDSTTNLINQNYYFIRDNFGTLELNDIESNVKFRRTGIDGGMTKVWTGSEWYKYDENQRENLEPLIIGDESLLMNYDYELDIDKDTYNELYLMQNVQTTSKTKDKNTTDKKIILAKQNEDTIKKWGILRKITNIKGSNFTQSELEEYAKLSLECGAQVNKTLKLEALGYNGVNAGDGFLLRLKKLGIEQMMYVISATHYYDSDKHTMSLDVATSRNLTEVI